MEFQKTIETRRSIRNYDASKKVTEDMIKEIIDAAQLAPTWKNSQTGRYYVIMSEDKKETFRNECLPAFNAKNSDGASAIIVTTFVKNHSGYERTTGEPTNELGNGWGIYDLGLQNENMILKAADMGLGTLIMGIRDEAKVKDMLNIPETEAVVSVIALGYSAAEAVMPNRKEIEEIIRIF